MVQYKNGCVIKALEDGDIDYMIHCCNARGVMGSGIAKQVKKKYPKAFSDYLDSYLSVENSKELMGSLSGSGGVINLISQYSYGYDGQRYTNYGAVSKGLSLVRERVVALSKPPQSSKFKIGIPYKMASDRGGADWDIILELVEAHLDWCEVYVYKL